MILNEAAILGLAIGAAVLACMVIIGLVILYDVIYHKGYRDAKNFYQKQSEANEDWIFERLQKLVDNRGRCTFRDEEHNDWCCPGS